MINTTLLAPTVLDATDKLSTLVEYRRAYALDHLELNIFETYTVADRFPLTFGQPVLLHMLQGKKVMHFSEFSSFDYLPGQLIALPANTKMHIDFPEASLLSPTQCSALTIRPSKIHDIVNYLNEFFPKQSLLGEWAMDSNMLVFAQTEEISALTQRLYQTILGNNPLKAAIADLQFKELLIRLLQHQSLLALDISPDKNSSVLHYLRTYIQQHLSEHLSVERLGKIGNMSKSSLFRLFKNELGLSPMEYVLRARVEKAKELLRLHRSVKETCFNVGFNDVNYFIRLFKRKVGLTPGAYKLGS